MPPSSEHPAAADILGDATRRAASGGDEAAAAFVDLATTLVEIETDYIGP